MNTTLLMPRLTVNPSLDFSLKQEINNTIDDLMARLPDIKDLTSVERRGIIARYTTVLEGNFIYWMTATLLAVKSEDARSIILDNLHEEVRDAHPAMMRRFAVAAYAFPTDADALVVDEGLRKLRVVL